MGHFDDHAPAARLRLAAVLGDGAVLLAFAAIGRASHHEQGDGPVLGALGTAAPFLAGWYLAGWLLGAYRSRAFSGQPGSATSVARSWLAGGALGLLLRSLLERHIVPPGFVAVAMSFNLTALLAWRGALVAIVGGRRSQSLDGR